MNERTITYSGTLEPLVRQALAERIRNDIANIGSIYGTVGAALWEEPVESLVGRILASVESTLKKLMPCPFCGSEDIMTTCCYGPEWNAMCRKCCSSTAWEQTEVQAIAAWNRRAPAAEKCPASGGQ
jgi:Lar family restriction alleviation protein